MDLRNARTLLIGIRDKGMLFDRESDEGSRPSQDLANALDVIEAALGRAWSEHAK